MNKRPKIPAKIQSQLLLANKHACCICHKLNIQIHHIDEDRSNNDLSNLAVLCLDHHDRASIKGGMSKKLEGRDIRKYKGDWETRCENDTFALTRDRLNFYATAYKNPPRIREMFVRLSPRERETAVEFMVKQIADEETMKKIDKGFKWQTLPRANDRTLQCLQSLLNGELWPAWLPRVEGHPLDPDYPIDLTPPNGMEAFHSFDLYCQLMVQVIAHTRGSIPLEQIKKLETPALIDSYSGSLVTFRERAFGKDIHADWQYKDYPKGQVQFRSQFKKKMYRTFMSINTMYIFSNTAVGYLQKEKICGIGLLRGVTEERGSKGKEVHLQITPWLIGVGGFNGPNPEGYWDFK